MMQNNSHGVCYVIVLFMLFICVCGDVQDYLKLQHSRTHLPSMNFDTTRYDDQEVEVTQQVDESVWNRDDIQQQESQNDASTLQKTGNFSYTLDPNIKWDKNWTSVTGLGQLSAVALDPSGNIGIFCRRERPWGQATFSFDNRFDPRRGPIRENAIILLNKQGKKILEWGRNTFYLPHGLTIDSAGNYWTTDVAMHMVMKFDAAEIAKNLEALKNDDSSEQHEVDLDDLFKKSIVKPSLVLGIAFEPGNDNRRFCKPTAVAVMNNGDFFVSDGYCNSRIIKFNAKGERIMHFGRKDHSGIQQQLSPYELYVPHALTLAEDLGHLFVADRENGRILAFHADNGTCLRDYRLATVSTPIYSIAYAQEKIYVVNGADIFRNFRVRGYVVDVKSGKVVSQFGPAGDMKAPHDIAVSGDGTEIYAVELNDQIIYKFLQGGNVTLSKARPTSPLNAIDKMSDYGLNPLNSVSADSDLEKIAPITITLTIIISAITIIGLTVAVAALVAKWKKRGCLLPRRSYSENDTANSYRLSRIVDNRSRKRRFRMTEKRPNSKDFSKLNTEETSEDDEAEGSLIL